jgi:hypothetical protein
MLIPFAWRLPNGITNASDDALEFSGDVCETWTWVCGGAVVAAVLAEAVIAWSHPSYDSPWERWGSVVANTFVALGVAGEIIFAMMAFRRDKELKRRSDDKVTKATNRAAKAEEELRELRRPRFISDENKLTINNRLTPFAGTHFDIGLGQGSGEQANFVWSLAPALWAAGWVQDDWNRDRQDGVHQGDRPWVALVWASNVEIHLHPSERARLLPAAEALTAALNDIGILAETCETLNVHNDNPTAIHIAVGDKR